MLDRERRKVGVGNQVSLNASRNGRSKILMLVTRRRKASNEGQGKPTRAERSADCRASFAQQNAEESQSRLRQQEDCRQPGSPEAFALGHGECFGEVVERSNPDAAYGEHVRPEDFARLFPGTPLSQSAAQGIVHDDLQTDTALAPEPFDLDSDVIVDRECGPRAS